MAKTEPLKISELTAVTTAKNVGVIPIVQDDITSKITFTNLTKNLVKSEELASIQQAIGMIQQEIETIQTTNMNVAPKLEQLVLDVEEISQELTQLEQLYASIEVRISALEQTEP